MEISLPGEQVQPLPKMANKNRKNNQKNKPNGFICFANSQKKELSSQYNIRGPQMLVQLCDPLWRKLTAEEKKVWNQKAKEEHARNTGRKPTDPALRMDCNRKIISERQDAERAQIHRRNREQRFVKEELERCEEIMDKEFYIVDALSIVEYLDGEFVPCEVGVVKCTIRDGITGHYHFFPDPGPLRAGFFAEALERCDLEHEIKPKDFPLASNDYELDVTKMIELMNLRSPKTPFIFARSSEAKRAESCLEWLGFRVNQEFKPKVMELESFIEELIIATRNQPPTFAQIRRLLFETKFDFVRGNRCDFHSQTDKIACSIGNVKKYLYFMCEMLYDYYEFDLLEGRHFPLGYEASSCPSRPSLSTPASSVIGDDALDEISSLASSFSIGSYEHKRNVEDHHPRKPDNSFSSRKFANDIPSSGSSISARSSKSLPNAACPSAPNSFSKANISRFSDSHLRTDTHSEPPRRPNSTDGKKPMSTPINAAYVSGVNSFATGVSPNYNQQRSPLYGNSLVSSPQQNSLYNRSPSLHSFSSPTNQSPTSSNTPTSFNNPSTPYSNLSTPYNNPSTPYNNPSTPYNNPSSYHNNPSNCNSNPLSSPQSLSSSLHNISSTSNNNPSNYNNDYKNNNKNNNNNPSNYNLHSPSPPRDSSIAAVTEPSPTSSRVRSRGRGLSSCPLGASSTLPPSTPTSSRGRARGTVPAAPLPRRPNVCPSKVKERT